MSRDHAYCPTCHAIAPGDVVTGTTRIPNGEPLAFIGRVASLEEGEAHHTTALAVVLDFPIAGLSRLMTDAHDVTLVERCGMPVRRAVNGWLAWAGGPDDDVWTVDLYAIARADVRSRRPKGVRGSFDAARLDASLLPAYREAYESAREHKREDRNESYRNALTRSVR